jgi:ribosomal-protein-alanine acetyltransferase
MKIDAKKKSSIEVVRMSEADIENVIQILIENKLETWNREDFLSEIKRQDSIALTAKLHTSVVGFCVSRLINSQSTNPGISKFSNIPDFINDDQNKVNSVLSLETETDNKDMENLETECEIYNIAVKNELQNCGIGTIILSDLIRLSSAFNCRAIWLEVRNSNQKAIEFYRKHKFKIMYERKNFYSNPLENAIVMKKEL